VATGLVTAPVVLKHDTGPGHPERPERVARSLERLAESGLVDDVIAVTPEPAPIEAITRLHPLAHLEELERAIESGVRSINEPDMGVSLSSWEAALTSSGAALLSADRIMSGEWQNALCLVRPPGHHAEAERAMGFCLINHAAICARHLQEVHGLARVAICDFDVHHGNGTQHLFEDDPSIFYASLHQWPLYPGTGAAEERGIGEGEGATLNVPLSAGSDDAVYLRALEEEVLPAIEAHRPEALILSAGFDAHTRDPLGGMEVTTEGFGRMTRLLLDLAAKTCEGRVISLLEGGYDLDGLAASVEAHTAELLA